MRIKKQLFLDFLGRCIFYKLVLLASLKIAFNLATAFNYNPIISQQLFIYVLLIAIGLGLLSWFTYQLQNKPIITTNLCLILVLAFICATAVNFQTTLTFGVITATSFLYTSPPFSLKRWKIAFVIKYALDATAIFILGLFLIWKYSGPYTFVIFIISFVILSLTQKLSSVVKKRLLSQF